MPKTQIKQPITLGKKLLKKGWKLLYANEFIIIYSRRLQERKAKKVEKRTEVKQDKHDFGDYQGILCRLPR